MSWKYFASGFFVKTLAGFDDSMVRIPICASVTKTTRGRYAFAIGTFFAITVAIIISIFFGSVIKSIPYSDYILGALIFILALSVYFEWFNHKEEKKVEKKIKKLKKISTNRFIELILIGFLVAFATIIDDTIAYSSLFVGEISNFSFVIAGIFLATILQLAMLIYFSGLVMKIKRKKEITFFALLILSVLVFVGVL